MRRKVSICIICVVFASCLSFVVGNERKKSNLNHESEQGNSLVETEEVDLLTDILRTSNEIQGQESYYVRIENDQLVVWDSDLFWETGIRVRELPKELIERLKEGISFETEEQLFDFLENYAS